MKWRNLVICGMAIMSMPFTPAEAINSTAAVQPVEGWYNRGGIWRDGMYAIRSTDSDRTENFVNQWGELLRPDGYLETGSFSEGLAHVKQKDSAGYIDVTGTIAFPISPDLYATTFSEGYSLIWSKDKNNSIEQSAHFAIIDHAGSVYAFPDEVRVMTPCSDGLFSAYYKEKGKKYGYLNSSGEWVIPPLFDAANSFSGGQAIIGKENQEHKLKYGVIDLLGNEVIPCIYDSLFIDNPSEENAPPVYRGLLYKEGEGYYTTLLDQRGETLVPLSCDYHFANGEASEGLRSVYYYDWGLWGILDLKTGNEISGPIYSDIGDKYHEGMIAVQTGDVWKYIDREGRDAILLPEPFSKRQPSGFHDGIAIVYNEAGDAYAIDKMGNLLFSLGAYEVATSDGIFSDGVVWGYRWSEEEAFPPTASYLIFDPRLKDYSSPWAAEEVAQAQTAGLVTESNDSYFTFRITRRRFAELMANLVEKTTGRSIAPAPEGTFSDTDDLWVRKAAALGLVNGLDDGSRFSPNGYINREQLAVMLHRTIQYLEDETGRSVLTEAGNLAGYADAGQVSDWAADSLAALTASGILQGTSSATLSPKDTTTVEQAILLTLRAYQEFS